MMEDASGTHTSFHGKNNLSCIGLEEWNKSVTKVSQPCDKKCTPLG
jgi:hypothetical protein